MCRVCNKAGATGAKRGRGAYVVIFMSAEVTREKARRGREYLAESNRVVESYRRRQRGVEPRELDERLAQLAPRYGVAPAKLKTQLAERDGLAEIEEQLLVSYY